MKKITKNKKNCPRITRINTNFQKKDTNITTSVGQWVSESVGQKVRSSKMRLKASKYSLHANYNTLSNVQHFAAFPVDSVHLKKPSVGPKGLIGPPCHWAPGRRRQK